MSASVASPPPPGGGPRKDGPGHKSPGSNATSPKAAARNRGDGATAKTAFWSMPLWNDPDQTQYLVFRRTMQAPNRWTRCTEGEARYDADAGFSVYRVEGPNARRVNLLVGETPRARGEAFYHTFREIEQEERDRVARHEPVGHEEDLLEDIDEEYDDQDPTPFDEPMFPSRSDTRGASSSSFGGHRSVGSTSSTGNPTTPRRAGPGSTSSPVSSPRQYGSPLSPHGGGPASSPRGDGSSSSPANKGKGRGSGSGAH